ncbi:MAG TPA: hypothetical protein VKR06_31940 [Ktedonosporobacter sp.]|nr:hypothetical protein [Ktedonosporobacter sp.]
METEENNSEVARLMQQIRLEYEAAERGLSGTAMIANHEFINARAEILLGYQKALIEKVGPEKAAELLANL